MNKTAEYVRRITPILALTGTVLWIGSVAPAAIVSAEETGGETVAESAEQSAVDPAGETMSRPANRVVVSTEIRAPEKPAQESQKTAEAEPDREADDARQDEPAFETVFEPDEATADLAAKVYISRVRNDVVFLAATADPDPSFDVTVNGRPLQEGAEYTVTPVASSGQARYTCAVRADLFAEEGEYRAAIRNRSPRSADQRAAQVTFVVDRTAPVVAVSGMMSGGRYAAENHAVTLLPSDYGGALSSLYVCTLNPDGSTLSVLVDLSGEALERELQRNEGKIVFKLGEGKDQTVRVRCGDRAGGDAKTFRYDKTFTDISVAEKGFLWYDFLRTLFTAAGTGLGRSP